MVVDVIASAPAAEGVSVRARCGEATIHGVPLTEDRFVFFGLPQGRCRIEATAHECYTRDRHATRTVDLPRTRLVLRIPAR